MGERISAREEIDASLIEDRGTDVGLVFAGYASVLRREVRRKTAGRKVQLRTYWITYEEVVE